MNAQPILYKLQASIVGTPLTPHPGIRGTYIRWMVKLAVAAIRSSSIGVQRRKGKCSGNKGAKKMGFR